MSTPDDSDVALPVFKPNTTLRADQLELLVAAIGQLRDRVGVLQERITRLEKQDNYVPIVLDFIPFKVIRFVKPINYPYRVYRRRGGELEDVTTRSRVVVNGVVLEGFLTPAVYVKGSTGVTISYRSQEFEFRVEVEPFDESAWEVLHVQSGPNNTWIPATGQMREQCASGRSGKHHDLHLQGEKVTAGVICDSRLLPSSSDMSELLLLVQSHLGSSITVEVADGSKILLQASLDLEPADDAQGTKETQFCEVPISWFGAADSVKVSGARLLAICKRKLKVKK